MFVRVKNCVWWILLMATTTIEARCNARPTRLAFILPHPDRALLFTVITRATSLWGGLFDPIIILDDSTRKTAGVHHTTFPPDPYLTVQRDLLKAFDPDLLINYSANPLPPELKRGNTALSQQIASIGNRLVQL